MKKLAAVMMSAAMVVCMVSVVFAFGASKKVGTIKSVDTEASSIVLTDKKDKDITLDVSKKVDLSEVKVGDKVQVKIKKDVVVKIGAPKKRSKAAVGC